VSGSKTSATPYASQLRYKIRFEIEADKLDNSAFCGELRRVLVGARADQFGRRFEAPPKRRREADQALNITLAVLGKSGG
jgi:hypothetical protein